MGWTFPVSFVSSSYASLNQHKHNSSPTAAMGMVAMTTVVGSLVGLVMITMAYWKMILPNNPSKNKTQNGIPPTNNDNDNRNHHNNNNTDNGDDDTPHKTMGLDQKCYAIPPPLLHSPLAREVDVAIRLAVQAGCNMYAYCNEKGTEKELQHDLGVGTKGAIEKFYTVIDVENETLVTNGLQQAFPTHRIIGEETVGMGSIPELTDDPTWIIDPVDGTTNFASGLPLTCVSIGLCVNRRPVLGVVFAPMTRELYVAVDQYGAFRNAVPLRKRSISGHETKALKDSIVCFEVGYARAQSDAQNELKTLERIMSNGYRSLKTFGSGVLDLCYVATGRLDVVYAGINKSSSWKPWDYCAGTVTINETGCIIEAIDQTPGEPFDIYSDSLICAVNRGLLDEVRKCIQASVDWNYR